MLDWAAGQGTPNYSVELSDDGETWRTAYVTTDGDGGRDPVPLPDSEAAWLRVLLPEGAPRAKLTDDTIAAVKAETIALAREWEDAGLMEDVEGFLAGLIIERDGSSPTQLNTLMTPDTVNGLLQLATRIEFIL